MYLLILILHLVIAVFIVALVLVQQGKGATIGSAFGSGASQTVFGSRGTGSFLLKVTFFFGILFFATSIGLNYLAVKIVKEVENSSMALPALPSSNNSEVTPNNIPSTIPQQ